MYACIEGLRRGGLSLRGACIKMATQGDFGAMSWQTAKSAYVKEGQRRRRHPRQPLARIVVEHNRRILAALAEHNRRFLAAVADAQLRRTIQTR